MTALWLIGLAWLVVGLGVLLTVLLDYRKWYCLRAENQALKDELIDATLKVVALKVECDRLGRQQFSGPVTVTHRGTSKTIRVRPVALFIRMFAHGN